MPRMNFKYIYIYIFFIVEYLVFQIRLKKNTRTNIRYRSTTTVDKDVTKARYESDTNAFVASDLLYD